MISKLVAVVTLTVLGFVTRRYIGLEKPWHILSLVLFYFSIPLTIFFSTINAPNIPMLLIATVLAFIHMCIVATLSFAIATKRGGKWPSIAVLVSLPNSLFLAIPLSEAALGSAIPALPHAIAFNGVLVISTAWLSYLTGRKRGVGTSSRALPHVLAFMTALVLRVINVAPLLLSIDAVHSLMLAINYLNLSAFTLIGAELAVAGFSLRKEVLYVAILRYITSPIILAAILLIPIIPPLPTDVFLGMFMQSFMPPAVTCIVLSKIYNLDNELTALSIAILTPISTAIALTIPIFKWM